jgi:hypothetical protein
MNPTQEEMSTQLEMAYSFLLSHSVTYVMFKTLFTEKYKQYKQYKQYLLNVEINVLTLH